MGKRLSPSCFVSCLCPAAAKRQVKREPRVKRYLTHFLTKPPSNIRKLFRSPFCLTDFFLLFRLLPVSGINCYTDVEMLVQEDCGMHTGCIKKFDTKSKYQRATPDNNWGCGGGASYLARRIIYHQFVKSNYNRRLPSPIYLSTSL